MITDRVSLRIADPEEIRLAIESDELELLSVGHLWHKSTFRLASSYAEHLCVELWLSVREGEGVQARLGLECVGVECEGLGVGVPGLGVLLGRALALGVSPGRVREALSVV